MTDLPDDSDDYVVAVIHRATDMPVFTGRVRCQREIQAPVLDAQVDVNPDGALSRHGMNAFRALSLAESMTLHALGQLQPKKTSPAPEAELPDA